MTFGRDTTVMTMREDDSSSSNGEGDNNTINNNKNGDENDDVDADDDVVIVDEDAYNNDGNNNFIENNGNDVVDDFNNNNNNNINDDDNNNNNNNNEENNDVTEAMLDAFDEALEEIPLQDKEDYSNALLFCPDSIWENECNPIRYIRAENYNIKLAALRLVKYWEMRCDIFLDHAFKPLTRHGAMKDIIDKIDSTNNVFRILPPDNKGRTVLCVDRTHFSFKDHDPTVLLKLCWFITHEALNKESTQKLGSVFISINQTSKWDMPSGKLTKLCWKSASEALPIKFCSLHYCVSTMTYKLLLPIEKLFMSTHMRQRIHIHHQSFKGTSSLLNELESYGLCRSKLPKSIGGSVR